MKNILRVVFLAALIALGFWGWSRFFPTPQAVIERRLLKVAQLASFSPNEGNIVRVANVQRLGTYFTENLEIKVDDPNLENHAFNRREELMQAALAARSAVPSIQAEFRGIRVDIAPDGNSATANLMLRATIGNIRDPILQELKVTLDKVNGDWLIHRIETVEILKH